MTYKKLTLNEWKEIGNKFKQIINAQNELFELLSRKVTKKDINKFNSAIKPFDNFRSYLDDLVCGEFRDLPDGEVTSIFYGIDNNVK